MHMWRHCNRYSWSYEVLLVHCMQFCFQIISVALHRMARSSGTFYFGMIRDDLTIAWALHYGDVIMGTIASQITSLAIVYSTVYSGADQRKHQSSASLAQMASNAENISIWWRHHVCSNLPYSVTGNLIRVLTSFSVDQFWNFAALLLCFMKTYKVTGRVI